MDFTTDEKTLLITLLNMADAMVDSYDIEDLTNYNSVTKNTIFELREKLGLC